jgi:outer membrane lipoprotein SlyB
MENVQSQSARPQAKSRLHPLVAGAAAAVIIASAVGVAAIGGYLPGSKAAQDESAVPGKAAEAKKPAKARQATHVASACTECGVVIDVKEETVMGKGTGVGAVAGGVAGAVIGHEVGDGSRAGTAVGAVVGGIAGHQIERSARSTKKYEISVRMPDGSVKVATTETPPAWRPGDKVRLHKGVVKPI